MVTFHIKTLRKKPLAWDIKYQKITFELCEELKALAEDMIFNDRSINISYYLVNRIIRTAVCSLDSFNERSITLSYNGFTPTSVRQIQKELLIICSYTGYTGYATSSINYNPTKQYSSSINFQPKFCGILIDGTYDTF